MEVLVVDDGEDVTLWVESSLECIVEFFVPVAQRAVRLLLNLETVDPLNLLLSLGLVCGL